MPLTSKLSILLLDDNGRESSERGRKLKPTWQEIMLIIQSVWFYGVCTNQNTDSPSGRRIRKRGLLKRTEELFQADKVPKRYPSPKWGKTVSQRAPTQANAIGDHVEGSVESPHPISRVPLGGADPHSQQWQWWWCGGRQETACILGSPGKGSPQLLSCSGTCFFPGLSQTLQDFLRAFCTELQNSSQHMLSWFLT